MGHRPEQRSRNYRPDLLEKVTGRAQFITDISVDGMAWGHVVRSTAVHALIRNIDTREAMAADGVVAILTGTDLAELGQPHWGLYFEDRPVIAYDHVRYVGEPVAVVIAETAAEAEWAAELVQVDYEDLPACVTAEDALEADAPLIHPEFRPISDFYFKGSARGRPGTNVFQDYEIARGDVEKAEAEAARIFEHSYSFPAISHYALEPHCSIARYDADGLTVWTGAQSPTAVQKVLSRVFRLPLAKVRVIVPYIGGGFGGKASVKIEPLAVAAAMKAGCPVKLQLSLEESMLTCRRLSARIRVRTGINSDGRILFRQGDLLLDGGAYADTGPAVALKAAHRLLGPYQTENLKFRVQAVYTNTVPGAAFRSIGGPQAVWATESHMDEIAQALGETPEAFRQNNMLERGAIVLENLRPLDADLGEMMRVAAHALEDDGTPANRARGLALAVTDPGILPVAGATVKLHADGSISVFSASVEIGQGVRGVLRGIAGEALAQPIEAVHILSPDTLEAPFDWGTGASRSSVLMGLAVNDAAADIARQIREMASRAFDASPDSVHLAAGGIRINKRFITFRELFHASYGIDSGDLIGYARITPQSRDGTLAQPPLFWETSAAACTIEVDEETGQINLLGYSGVADIGYALNPSAAEGQEEGASVQGLGHALMEQLVFEAGQPVNATAVTYRIPAIDQIASEQKTTLIENGDGPGVHGSKGMGEGGILPIAPAIANALARQYGIRLRDLPMTAEKIWLALQEGSGHAS